MLDKRKEFALLFQLILCAYTTRLPHVLYDKLLQRYKSFINEVIDIILGLH